MAISPEQKTAIEQVIHVITATKAPRGRRMLCEMFMVLLDKDEWQEYYEVPSLSRLLIILYLLVLRLFLNRDVSRTFKLH